MVPAERAWGAYGFDFNNSCGLPMTDKIYSRKTYDQALVWLRNHSFELADAPGEPGRTLLRKYGCAAGIERNEKGVARIFATPGIVIGGEVSRLVDHGYQKHLVTSKVQRAATAEDLRALHSFAEEMKEAMGVPSLYNESLGTVSSSYEYDRVLDRDKAVAQRPERPWEADKNGQ
jgi:hypothetical protein